MWRKRENTDLSIKPIYPVKIEEGRHTKLITLIWLCFTFYDIYFPHDINLYLLIPKLPFD